MKPPPAPKPPSSTSPMPARRRAVAGAAQRAAAIAAVADAAHQAPAAATLVAGTALTAAFWPSEAPIDAAGSARPPTARAGDATPARRRPRAAPADLATLLITVDLPAVICVDGQASRSASRATVKVKSGIEHVVRVQRRGHSLRTPPRPGTDGEPAPAHQGQGPLNRGASGTCRQRSGFLGGSAGGDAPARLVLLRAAKASRAARPPRMKPITTPIRSSERDVDEVRAGRTSSHCPRSSS